MLAMAAAAQSDSGAQGGAELHLMLTGSAVAVRRADATRVPLARLDAALLAVLALEGSASRHRLLQLLWPDQEPEAARNALRQRLFRLRRAMGAEVVSGHEQLSLADRVTHDIAHLDTDGELLAGWDYADCPQLDEWLQMQRRALRERRRAHDADRIAQCEREGRHADGAALAERLIAADPLDEAAVRQAMRLHYLAGQHAPALAAFERFAAELAADCPAAMPARDTTDLLATIREARASAPAVRREIPASVLRPPRLVGRDAALQAMALAWSAGRAFWLLGEAGLGKSRVIAEFAGHEFGRSGAVTLAVAARPGDGGVPYASLGRALRALIERRPALLEHAERGELARVLPEVQVTAVAKAAIGAQMVLQHAIRSLLQHAMRDGLAALVFDDLHFADPASLEMLQGLVGDDALGSLRWGFAQRPGESAAPIAALRGALEDLQRIDITALPPLVESQMAELIDSLALPTIDAAQLAPALTRHTGGNPMYALETIKHLIASGSAGAAGLPRPASVAQLIERRLRQLTAQALTLARVAAVAGVDFSIELAQAVLGARALALADAWQELEAAQVLRGNAFAHDLVYEATLASVPAPIAAHTHGEVAAFLEAHGGEPARVAAHWIAAEQPRRALASLHAAAEAARRAMRRKEEAAFLQRAATIESESGERDAAYHSWRTMLDALWNADYRSIDVSMLDRLETMATNAAQRAAAVALRASWAQANGDLVEAKRRCRAAIDLADAAGDEDIAADARQRLADMLQFDGQHDDALALLQPLLPWATERAADAERAVYYGTLGVVLDSCERGAEARSYHQRAIETSRKAQRWGDVVVVLGNLATSWAIAGHTQRAVDVLREAMQLAAAHDEARGCGAALPAEMYKSLRDSARYAEALRWLEPALANEPGNFLPLLKCHVACGWIHLGQHARAQREIDAALELQMPALVRAKALQMRARLKVALGQRGARTLIDEALRIVQDHPGRRTLRASIVLDHALTREPPAALSAARGIVAEAERLDLAGTALAGHVRASRFAVDADLAAEAVAHARAALAIGDDVAPNDLYPGERWLHAWRAFTAAAAEADAADALQRGVQWVRTIAQDHVPEPFRDAFVRANAVNQQLLRAAA